MLWGSRCGCGTKAPKGGGSCSLLGCRVHGRHVHRRREGGGDDSSEERWPGQQGSWPAHMPATPHLFHAQRCKSRRKTCGSWRAWPTPGTPPRRRSWKKGRSSMTPRWDRGLSRLGPWLRAPPQARPRLFGHVGMQPPPPPPCCRAVCAWEVGRRPRGMRAASTLACACCGATLRDTPPPGPLARMPASGVARTNKLLRAPLLADFSAAAEIAHQDLNALLERRTRIRGSVHRLRKIEAAVQSVRRCGRRCARRFVRGSPRRRGGCFWDLAGAGQRCMQEG